jgi:hypothetical protein
MVVPDQALLGGDATPFRDAVPRAGLFFVMITLNSELKLKHYLQVAAISNGMHAPANDDAAAYALI